mgnify:CR=1 FL=1
MWDIESNVECEYDFVFCFWRTNSNSNDKCQNFASQPRLLRPKFHAQSLLPWKQLSKTKQLQKPFTASVNQKKGQLATTLTWVHGKYPQSCKTGFRT